MALKIIWNDICAENSDAIVTPASRFPRIGVGLDKHIHQIAGPKLLMAREELGNIGPGTVQVSPSYGLRAKTGAKWVIHALGPIWDDNASVRDELILSGCYFRILCKAVELKCRTVSVPVMSSGKFGMPMDKALRIAVEAIETFLRAVPSLMVKLVGIDSDFIGVAQKEFGKYCTKSCFSAAKEAVLRKELGDRRYDKNLDRCDELMPTEEDPYFVRYSLEKAVVEKSFRKLFRVLWDARKNADLERRRLAKKAGQYDPKNGDEDFGLLTGALALAHATGISYRAIRYFCADANGAEKTTKDKVFALCVALQVPLDYAKALLGTCGHRFDANSQRDKLIRDWIVAGSGNVDGLNFLLEEKRLGQLDVAEKKRQVKPSKCQRRKKK